MDADAESAAVTCGALPDYGIWLPVTEAPGTSHGRRDGRHRRHDDGQRRVHGRATPAGADGAHAVTEQRHLNYRLGGMTSKAPAASPPPVQNAVGRDQFDSYLFRYRDLDAGATAPYEIVEPLKRSVILLHPSRLTALGAGSPTEWEGMVAAIRHPIEQQTPAALNWSPPIQFGTVTEPQNVVVQATHKHAGRVVGRATLHAERLGGRSWVLSFTSRIAVARSAPRTGATTRASAISRRTATMRSPSAPVTVSTPNERTGSSRPRTVAAPEDWEPPPRGPNNLRATATHDSITVFWDPPFPRRGAGLGRHGVRAERLSHRHRLAGRSAPERLDDSRRLVGLEPETTYRVIVAHDGGDGASAEITITTNAAPPPLRLTLTAGRAECTTGTLNPVSWEISGGVGPYRLTVDGASVEAEAEGATVTCGALPDYGIWLPVTQAPGTIPATVTDATGAPATASAAYTIVPPLRRQRAGGPRAAYAHAGPVGRCARARLRPERDARLPLPLISPALAGR